MFKTDSGSITGRNPHLPAGMHYTWPAKPHVTAAETSPGHHQVGDIPRIQAAERYIIPFNCFEQRSREEIIFPTFKNILVMNVNVTGFFHNCVIKVPVFCHVTHCIDVISHESTGFPFAKEISCPVEFMGCVFFPAFCICKTAINGPEHVVSDRFAVMYGVHMFRRILPIPFPLKGLVIFCNRHCPWDIREFRFYTGIPAVP